MPTDEQLAANAQNAKKSTGPRTPKGRARSSMNALRHGLSARDFVVFERERQEFETFLAAWSLDLRPAGALEEELFAQITQAAWNMRRVRRAESNLTGEKNKWFKDAEDDPLTKSHKISYLNHYGRYHARNERSFYRALRELHRLQTTRVPHEAQAPESVAPGAPPSLASREQSGADLQICLPLILASTEEIPQTSCPVQPSETQPAGQPLEDHPLHRAAPLACNAELTERTQFGIPSHPVPEPPDAAHASSAAPRHSCHAKLTERKSMTRCVAIPGDENGPELEQGEEFSEEPNSTALAGGPPCKPRETGSSQPPEGAKHNQPRA